MRQNSSNTLPRSYYVRKIYLQHSTGVETPLPKIGVGLKNSFNRYISFYKGLAGKWGSVIISICWYVRDAAIRLVANSFVGVQDIAASLVLKANGKSELVKLEMLMPVNIVKLKMVATVRIAKQINSVKANVLNVVQQTTYNSLILNLFGPAELINMLLLYVDSITMSSMIYCESGGDD